jgi:hypothetical protein
LIPTEGKEGYIKRLSPLLLYFLRIAAEFELMKRISSAFPDWEGVKKCISDICTED